MSLLRSVFNRLMPLVVPKTVTDYVPPPERLDSNLWTLERRAVMPGGPVLPTRTVILGIGGGELLVVSPPPAECGGLEQIDALGMVRHIVAPNAFHHLHVRDFLVRYPSATFWAAPGLFARVSGLPDGVELVESAAPPWHDAVDHAVLRVTPEISEAVFFHRESATLVLTDLAFHMVRFDRPFDRIAWRMNGVPSQFGHSRTARMMLLRDRAVIAPFLTRVLEWPFARILVSHGDPVERDAHETFRRAFAAYLP